MTNEINSNYLEKYSSAYASEVCQKFFASKKYISGQDIVQLTDSIQVNFFILKRLFELWQDELGKLKSNPYFDYRDISVHEALTQFMNVLSKRIKVEQSQFEPLVKYAVEEAIRLATDPVGFYQGEIANLPSDSINSYLKENKKYYKWHLPVINFLIDKTGFGHDKEAYLKAISTNFQAIKESLESVNMLMATLGGIKPFDLDLYIVSPAIPEEKNNTSSDNSFFDEVGESENQDNFTPESPKEEIEAPKEEKEVSLFTSEVKEVSSGNGLIATRLKARFESENYKGAKGVIVDLSEGLALNQRFMFTKELFEGNSDLMMHALNAIDQTGTFERAVDLINTRYLGELNWNVESEAVQELLQLVYRRFDED